MFYVSFRITCSPFKHAIPKTTNFHEFDNQSDFFFDAKTNNKFVVCSKRQDCKNCSNVKKFMKIRDSFYLETSRELNKKHERLKPWFSKRTNFWRRTSWKICTCSRSLTTVLMDRAYMNLLIKSTEVLEGKT